MGAAWIAIFLHLLPFAAIYFDISGRLWRSTVGEQAVSENRLLTVKEVAERLRVNPETVRRWLRQGRLRGVLMGGDRGGYRISENEMRRITSPEFQSEGDA